VVFGLLQLLPLLQTKQRLLQSYLLNLQM